MDALFRINTLLPAFNGYSNENVVVPVHVISCTTTPCKEQFNLLNVNLMLCVQVFIQGPHITTIQHKQLKAWQMPTYSGIAENPISNMHCLLLRNLKRICTGIAEPIPKLTNKFKPLWLKHFFPKGKPCFSLAGKEPLMFAARLAFTYCMLTASINQLHQTEVLFPIHLLFSFISWKIVSKTFTNI